MYFYDVENLVNSSQLLLSVLHVEGDMSCGAIQAKVKVLVDLYIFKNSPTFVEVQACAGLIPFDNSANSQYSQVLGKIYAFRVSDDSFDKLNCLQSIGFLRLNLGLVVTQVPLRLTVK